MLKQTKQIRYFICVIATHLNDFLILFISAIRINSGTKARSQNQQNSIPLSNGTNGAHLHKLLVSGTSTAPVITTTINGSSNGTSELARLPGGAELNILPTNSNGTTLYRGNSQLAIIKGNVN